MAPRTRNRQVMARPRLHLQSMAPLAIDGSTCNQAMAPRAIKLWLHSQGSTPNRSAPLAIDQLHMQSIIDRLHQRRLHTQSISTAICNAGSTHNRSAPLAICNQCSTMPNTIDTSPNTITQDKPNNRDTYMTNSFIILITKPKSLTRQLLSLGGT
jgi:hypothetical protein